MESVLDVIKFSDGEEAVKDMRDFKATRNETSEGFTTCLSSRTAFVQKYVEIATTPMLPNVEMNDRTYYSDDNILDHDNARDTPDIRPSSFPLGAEVNQGVTRAVHIRNLFGPSACRQVRRLNSLHVQRLKTKFMQRQAQSKLLLGLLTSGSLDDVGLEGKAAVETIGGNHSRAAIQALLDEGKWSGQYLHCTLIEGLSEEEVLAKGMTHNIVDGDGEEMTFLEKTKVIREIKKLGSRWSPTAKTIFGYKTTKETLNKLRTMAAVADLPENLWARLCAVEGKSVMKKAVKQTAFTHFVTLQADIQNELLTVWEEEGFSSYKAALKREMEKKRGTDENTPSIQENVCNQNVALKEEIARLRKENELLKTALAEKDRLISDLKETVNQASNSECNQGELNSSKDDDSNQPTTISRPRKRKPDNSVDQEAGVGKTKRKENPLEEGDEVWAFYAPDKTFYPAKILKYNSQTNKYRVEFTEDGIQKVLGIEKIKKMDKLD